MACRSAGCSPASTCLSVLEGEGHDYRSRVFCPLVTLWAWLSQCLSQDKSLNEAVSPHSGEPCVDWPAGLLGIPRPATAKARIAVSRVGNAAHGQGNRPQGSRQGRRIMELARPRSFLGRWHHVLDARHPRESACLSEEPQSGQPGIGFPIMRAVALVSLATGAVFDMAFAKYAGKGTGETSLFRKVSQ